MKTPYLTIGFWSALFTSFLTVVTFIIAFLTPPLSGPLCQGVCYQYPYTDIVSRFPRDYYWIYPAMLLVIAYFILIVSIHYFAPPEKKILSHLGVFFAFLATSLLLTDFFIQVSVIQPSLVRGETEGISLLTQFNPHGIFIVLEELGYLVMSLSFLFLSPVFSGKNKLENSLRWIFIINFLLTILSFIAFSVMYGLNREYRFEITSITINWIALIISGILLSLVFRRTNPN